MDDQLVPENFTIEFEPIGKRVFLSPDKTIMDASLLSGLDLITSCNGLGACASCKIQSISGSLSPLTTSEIAKLTEQEINEGIRLACQVKPLSNLRIYIPPSSLIHGQQLQIDGDHQALEFNPSIQAIDIKIPPFGPHDLYSDWERVKRTCLENNVVLSTIAFPVLQDLPNVLRENQWKVRVLYNQNRMINIVAPESPFYGIALDIGSTKIASYWVDLQTGAIIHQTGFMNPQISFGEDVVNRIAYANQSTEHQHQLQKVLIQSINQHIQETCSKFSIDKNQIVDMVVVGNSVIQHLFCGIPVRPLGEAPYTPVIKEALEIPATSLNLDIAPGADVFIPPLIAGYVGADHTAGLIATRFNEFRDTTCLIDVGTNTEISLIFQGQTYSCSCASGPAFEGAHIHDGMRAAPGAIDKITIEENQISFSTISQRKPVGICGSGILSGVAEMRKNNIIDRRGVFQKAHPLTKIQDGQKFIVIAEREEDHVKHSIRISRHDVNEIQLAKGAIRTGIEILCQEAGILPNQVQKFLIAGAFGNHLDLASAIEIGMFPEVSIERYSQIGNAAGVGSREMLLNKNLRKLSSAIIEDIQYIELTSQQSFKDTYINALSLEKNDHISQ
ncbi:MAG: hypothetical protein CVU46_13990 [Chloroflexi bacterium HGW-Chloroflexi-8]|nr:MAG: hypothetical protein CVU46_13990 [Chloroflexi bacterium HGW-Chloroflexi-8]